MNRHKTNKKSTGAGFQDKTSGTGVGTSRTTGEKKITREERASSKIRSGLPIASSMKSGKTNVNDWQKPKLQGKATLDLMGCALEKFSQETTETFNASKLKKHKKPHQQEGNMLQKWKDKCYLRRQQRKHAGEWKEKQNASLQPWIKVDRKKIKTNSMLRFAT